MSIARCLSFIVALWLIFTGTSSLAQASFSQLVIFGDSLSDTGNVAGVITPNLPPPYFDNRISNGPLTVDVFAESLGQNAAAAADGGRNYAVVGGNIVGNDFEDLTSQVDRYFVANGSVADPAALYLLFLGGNDLRGIRGQPNALLASQQIDATLLVLQTQIERLVSAGATNIVVANVADIGRIPETLEKEVNEPGIAARASAYVGLYNARFNEQLRSYAAQSTIRVYDFDVFLELSKILDSPAQFGFLRADVGCFDPDGFDFHPDCENPLFPFFAPRFERFVFFDNLHPTAQAHAIVGSGLIARLASEALPSALGNSRIISLQGILLLLLD